MTPSNPTGCDTLDSPHIRDTTSPKSAQLTPKSLLLILTLVILGYKYNTLDYIFSHVTQPLNSPQEPMSQFNTDTVDTSTKAAKSNTATMAWAAAAIVGAVGYGFVIFRLARENRMRKELEVKVEEDKKRERMEEVAVMKERLERLGAR